MKDWGARFREVSSGDTAAFGVSTLTVTTSPSPREPWTFDLQRVPGPLFVALTVAGVALACSASYSLGEVYERERHYGKRVVGLSHVRRVKKEPLLGYRKEKEWALREALAHVPSRSQSVAIPRRELAVTRRDVA